MGQSRGTKVQSSDCIRRFEICSQDSSYKGQERGLHLVRFNCTEVAIGYSVSLSECSGTQRALSIWLCLSGTFGEPWGYDSPKCSSESQWYYYLKLTVEATTQEKFRFRQSNSFDWGTILKKTDTWEPSMDISLLPTIGSFNYAEVIFFIVVWSPPQLEHVSHPSCLPG